jgi:hypothetical protein
MVIRITLFLSKLSFCQYSLSNDTRKKVGPVRDVRLLMTGFRDFSFLFKLTTFQKNTDREEY